MIYRREIDGLRALAVLPVILFHAGIELFSGGFIGVDIFFVISGYLITATILSDLKEGRFSIFSFYERRARRILPALFLVFACCIPIAWLWLLPIDLKNFAQSLTASSLFASNILFWYESGYFDTATELKPLLHTWSLSLEEQYYLFFPLLLIALANFGYRIIGICLCLILALSFTLSLRNTYTNPNAAFYLLPNRCWELIVGALVALHLSPPPQSVNTSARAQTSPAAG